MIDAPSAVHRGISPEYPKVKRVLVPRFRSMSQMSSCGLTPRVTARVFSSGERASEEPKYCSGIPTVPMRFPIESIQTNSRLSPGLLDQNASEPTADDEKAP